MVASLASRLGLLALATSPLVFLLLVACASTGRDLTTFFLVGSFLFLCLGTCLVVCGLRKRQPRKTKSGVAVLACLVLSVLPLTITGSGRSSRDMEVVVKVMDANTKQPIPAASVHLSSEEWVAESEARTAADGIARLTHKFTAIFHDGPVHHTGSVILLRITLQVDAEGYDRVREPLEKYTERVRELYGPPLPVVVVLLHRKPPKQVMPGP